MTEEEAMECYLRAGATMPSVGVRMPAVQPRKERRVLDGPINITLVLYGHCPSKKNLWRRGTAGKMFLDSDVKKQIDTLTTQALFQWKSLFPVEHPDITVKLYVNAARRDRDGLLTTILDCLQAAGVIVNDNLAHNNGRMVIEAAEFVDINDERVEIQLERLK